jgi:polysaccharide export outer membrane protein
MVLQLLVVSGLFTTLSTQRASAEYRLDSGDILEISVFRRADLERRMTIDPDGNLLVPLIGEVRAAGLSLAALRAKVKDLLATSDSVRGADVMVTLVEYRPFYIYGNVVKAGAFPYHPGMTVRHALAVAGGFGLAGASMNASPAVVAGLRGQYEELQAELAKQQVRVVALQADANDKTEIDLTSLPPMFAVDERIKEFIRLENEDLKARDTARKLEKKSLEATLRLVDNRISALMQAQRVDEEATKQQVQEFDRVAELSRKGLAPSARVTDEQRAAVLSRSRELDTAARLSLAQESRELVLLKLEQLDNRATRLPKELQAALSAVEQARGRLKSVAEQLFASGSFSPQIISDEQRRAEIRIFRKSNAATAGGIKAGEDSTIEPGDVLEIGSVTRWPRSVELN